MSQTASGPTAGTPAAAAPLATGGCPGAAQGPAERTWAAFIACCLLPRVLVAGVFLIAGVSKVATPAAIDEFVKEIRNYQLLPVLLSNPLAYVLPWFEVLLAVLLLLGVWLREVRAVLVLMLVAFIGAKFWLIANNLPLECGCVPKTSLIYPLFNGVTGIVTNFVMIAFLGLDWAAGRRVKSR